MRVWGVRKSAKSANRPFERSGQGGLVRVALLLCTVQTGPSMRDFVPCDRIVQRAYFS